MDVDIYRYNDIDICYINIYIHTNIPSCYYNSERGVFHQLKR